jgi:hypothetical protein
MVCDRKRDRAMPMEIKIKSNGNKLRNKDMAPKKDSLDLFNV